MLTLGWALVYLPWMPEGFLHTTELGAPGSSLLDALYFSLVTLSDARLRRVSPSTGCCAWPPRWRPCSDWGC